ncbi:MAG: peptidoglycan-binding protein [Actinomycetota bacterium]
MNGHQSVDVEALLAAGQRSGRRWPALLLGLALGAAGAVAVVRYLDGGDEVDADGAAEVALATALVEQRDLQEEIEWSGTLGYGEPFTWNGSGGVVTATPEPGDSIERGDPVVWIDGAPVVAFYGDTPLWRTLAEGVEGRDVLLLESNLAALGYDPDATVDIDQTFTANTEAMVERWQEDLGREVTGRVASADVVVVEGPSAIVAIPAVGQSASGPLVTLAPRQAVTDVVAVLDGVVTELAPIGTPLDHGQLLYRIDGLAVTAIDRVDPVAAVLLSDSFTVFELEEALAAEGHDPEDEMTVDGLVTVATEAAVVRWQAATDLPESGIADPSGYWPATPDRSVAAHPVADGEYLSTGGPVLTATASQLSVSVTVDVAEADEFTVGQIVTIELADERTVEGTVVEIGPVTQAADPQSTPTQSILIAVTGGDETSLIEGPVTVVSIGEVVTGATVVPTRALLALAEGGFAVEKVVGGDVRLVGVQLGTFDDGLVEVVESDLAPGDEVVVPR